MTINQILYYILIVKLTDFNAANKTQLNSLSLSIFDSIEPNLSHDFFLKHLSRLLFEKINMLQSPYTIEINPTISEKVNGKLNGKILKYFFSHQPDLITIDKIAEAGSSFNYLSSLYI